MAIDSISSRASDDGSHEHAPEYLAVPCTLYRLLIPAFFRKNKGEEQQPTDLGLMYQRLGEVSGMLSEYAGYSYDPRPTAGRYLSSPAERSYWFEIAVPQFITADPIERKIIELADEARRAYGQEEIFLIAFEIRRFRPKPKQQD